MAKYDVAILGAGLGGLAAAALLSKTKKTVVIEQGPSLRNARGLVEKDGFLFSTGPALSYGFGHGEPLRELATELGMEQQISTRPLGYQVAIPGHRINVYSETERTLEELSREFRDEIGMIAQFYRDLSTTHEKAEKSRLRSYLIRHRSAGRFMRNYNFSVAVSSFFDVQSFYFFQKPAAELSLAGLYRLCCTPPAHLDGGFAGVADQLCRVIREHGGEVCHDPSAAVSIRNSVVDGIATKRGLVEADAVLLNTLPSAHKSLLFVGLLEEVIPIGMSPNVLFLPEAVQPRDFSALSVDVPEGAKLSGAKGLSASFSSTGRKETHVEQLETLIPFLNDFLFFAEEYKPEAGHASAAADLTGSSLPVKGSGRTAHKNVYVIHDAPEAPLQAVMAAQRFCAKFN